MSIVKLLPKEVYPQQRKAGCKRTGSWRLAATTAYSTPTKTQNKLTEQSCLTCAAGGCWAAGLSCHGNQLLGHKEETLRVIRDPPDQKGGRTGSI